MLLVSLAVGVASASSLDFTRPDSLVLNAEEGVMRDAATVASAEGQFAKVEQQRFVTEFPSLNPEQPPVQLPGFRTVVEVQGYHSYSIMMEDYPGFEQPMMVERGFPIDDGISVAGYRYDKGGDDILLKVPDRATQMFRVLKVSAAGKEMLPGMRTGGPAKLVTGEDGTRTLVVPTFSSQPSIRALHVGDARDVPVTKWLDGGRVLRVEWHDQIDVYTFDTATTGQTRFLLERTRGEHSNEVLSFGLPYVPVQHETGNLIAHWSFDGVKGNNVPDVSGHGFDATMQGGLRLTSGVRGYGIDGVSCDGVRAGELVIPTQEGELPGKLEFGEVVLPGAAFKSIKDKMTLTFWYAMPPTINGAYHPYMKYWQSDEPHAQFEFEGLKLYSYDHWMNGHCITAAGLGNHRLFGMIGPPQPRDMWNHYAIVIDGLEARIYINGDLRLQETGKQTLEGIISSTEAATALKNIWARMDEIRLYDYPLSMDEIQQQFRQDGLGRLCRLSFDQAAAGTIGEGIIQDEAGNAYEAENVEIVEVEQALLPVQSLPEEQRGTDKSVCPTGERGGNVLCFAEEGGRIQFPASITQGKHIDAVTFATWVRLPEGYNGRSHLLSSGNHGHVGMFVGFWRNNIFGTASQNGFVGSVTPGQWTHVVCSYGHNRIRTYINGEKVQDNDQAYPSGKGWGVGRFSLSYDAGLEIDEVQLFSFNLTDDQVHDIYTGKAVNRPPENKSARQVEKTVITANNLR